MRFIVAALLLTGCYSESDFVPEQTDAFCAYLLECTDPAVLAFDGVTADSCQGTYGPLFRDAGTGCKFRRKAAKDCITALETAQCPPEGERAEDHLPDICEAAFHTCPSQPADPVEETPVEETGTPE